MQIKIPANCIDTIEQPEDSEFVEITFKKVYNLGVAQSIRVSMSQTITIDCESVIITD